MKKWLILPVVVLSAVLLWRSIPQATRQRVYQQALQFSAISILPQGYTFFKPTASAPQTPSPALPPAVADTPSAPIESAAAPYTADPATALGKVIRKNLSPYNANTAYQKVYVSNKTSTTLDIGHRLQQSVGFALKGDGRPEILLYHTHGTECYLPEARDFYVEADATRSQNPQQNVVAVGQAIKAQLEAAGFGVVHNTTLHDASAYSGSYDRSAQSIEDCLQAYPDVQIIIDLHRDSISHGDADKIAPVAQINGRSAAQVMLCIASGTGGIAGFDNWEKNLPFALRLQQSLEENYPTLARSALFLSQRYNQNFGKVALLIEVGSEANSLQEALYAAELTGKTLAALLTECKEK